MGFLVTTLIFAVIGIIASLCTRICCNRGPSANLFHLTLVITATVCCWMICDDLLSMLKPILFAPTGVLVYLHTPYLYPALAAGVGNCISCTNEAAHRTHFK